MARQRDETATEEARSHEQGPINEADGAPDPSVREQEAAAAREAGEIGGKSGLEGMDEAERASAEHGGGVAEGFEQAEQRLEEEATSDEAEGDPLRDAGEAEEPHELQTGGEADEVDSTETDEETQGTPGDLDGSAG